MQKTYNTQEALSHEAAQEPTQPQAPQGPGGSPAMQGEQPKKELSRSDQAYIAGLMKLLHGKETARIIEEQLQAGPPEEVIPMLANQINDQMEEAIKKKPPLETTLTAGVYLVQDLIEIGNTAGFFELSTEEQIKPIMQATMQQYIERGLKDGSIDPIELQQSVEGYMDDDQMSLGLEAAQKTGIPAAPNQTTVMSVYGRDMERKGMMKGGGAK